MQVGAVAVLDALGFKGVWRRTDPTAVLTKLEYMAGLTGFIESRIGAGFTDVKGALAPRAWARLFSDTVIIGCCSTTGTEVPVAMQHYIDPTANVLALYYLCEAVAMTIGYAANAEPPPALAYRGSIAFGEFEMREHFVIGPAIDEAAESEGLADGAIVWMCPSATQFLAEADATASTIPEFRELMDRFWETAPMVRDYPVPMKSGQRYRSNAIDPFAWVLTDRLPAVLGMLLSSFTSDRMDVSIKKQNTEAFLQEAMRRADNPRRAEFYKISKEHGLA